MFMLWYDSPRGWKQPLGDPCHGMNRSGTSLQSELCRSANARTPGRLLLASRILFRVQSCKAVTEMTGSLAVSDMVTSEGVVISDMVTSGYEELAPMTACEKRAI